MINLTYLKYFFDTVRFESVSKAAQKNFVTQSAVSQGISKLEKTLKTPLLKHKSNTIKITTEGRTAFEYCLSIFHTLDRMVESVQQNNGEYSGELVFGCSYSMASSLLPEVLVKLHTEAPKIKQRVLPGHIKLIKEWLYQGRIEFGFVLENEDVSSLQRIPIYSGNFKLYQSVNRKKKKNDFDSIIATEPRAEVNKLKEDYFEKYGVKLTTFMEISSWEVIANMVTNNVGVGLLPDFLALLSPRKDQIVPCPIKIAPIPYQISIVFNKDETLSRNGKLFVSLFQELFSEKKFNNNGD